MNLSTPSSTKAVMINNGQKSRLNGPGDLKPRPIAQTPWHQVQERGGDVIRAALLLSLLAIGVAFLITALQPVLFVALAMALPVLAPFVAMLVAFLHLQDRPSPPRENHQSTA